MPQINVREIAEAALADILAKPKGTVYASRRGIVAGSTQVYSENVLFRREGGKVRLELWPRRGGRGPEKVKGFPLPADLERRAGEILDSL